MTAPGSLLSTANSKSSSTISDYAFTHVQSFVNECVPVYQTLLMTWA